MIEITGGTYIESCIWPAWHEIYGSGLRAAIALRECYKNKIRFHTFMPKSQEANIRAITASHGIDLVPTQTDSAIKFFYYHGLSTPYIYPNPNLISKAASLKVKGKSILRFGFIEGDAIVCGDRVVYDPQSPDPMPFRKNGSTAKRLALILNQYEAISYIGKNINLPKLAFNLKQKEGAEIVVIKLGSKGCILIDKNDKISYVPVYETNYVWKIGSGDIFSAFFAFGWAELQLTPIKACFLASKAAAYYCGLSKGSLPIPRNFNKLAKFSPLIQRNSKQRKKIYLAGPFFNMGQRWLIEEALAALKWDVDVFSPLHEVGTGSAKEIYGLDINGLNSCDVVFACLDDLDPGTVYEIGYAQAQNKPVIVYVNSKSSEGLKMIEGSGCFITDDFTTAIYKAIWTAMRL